MWKGTGPFQRYSYYGPEGAYLKGTVDSQSFNPHQCYKIINTGKLRNHDQFQLVPVDADDTITGAAVLKTNSTVMASIWHAGSTAQTYDISNYFIE